MKLRMDWLPEWVSAQYFQAAWHEVRVFFEKTYREREIILRSEGQVRYLRLTRQMQVFSSVVCLLFLWLGVRDDRAVGSSARHNRSENWKD